MTLTMSEKGLETYCSWSLIRISLCRSRNRSWGSG